MKPEQIYGQLIELAEKFGISVYEKNLKGTGIKVNSGLCRIKDKTLFVMDKHESLREKIRLLSGCLGEMPLDEVYVIPAVREEIRKHIPVKRTGEGATSEQLPELGTSLET